MKINRSTTVQLVGRGSLKLNPTDYLASGGEGVIYRVGDTVIKLYHDGAKMARDGIVDKLDCLSKLTQPYLVAPRGIVTDSHNQPIGWYMDYADGEPLARAFTNDWRKQHKFGDHEAAVLADHMRQVVEYAHDHGAVMADANELNWSIVMSGKAGPEPRALDVDSWSIGHWPARVVMPSIRDWHTKGITTASDWFAWGIVTFQLFTGLHPYKGTLAGYKPSELERRMKDNASVFTPGVRLNRAVRDFTSIPGPLLDWYQATFADGRRELPPSPLQTAAPKRTARTARVTVAATGALVFELLYDGQPDPATRIFHCGVIQLASGKLYDLGSNRVIGAASTADSLEVIRVDSGWLIAYLDHQGITAQFIGPDLRPVGLTTTIAARQLVRTDQRLFAVTDQGLVELTLLRLGKPQLVVSHTWGALPSTQWFDGIGIQDTFGTTHLILPFGDDSCAHLRVPELDNSQLIIARAGHRFASVITMDMHGDYRKFEFNFSRDYRQYTVWSGTVDSPELNLAILPRGVCATIISDGELVIFVPGGDIKRVPDRDATTALTLGQWDNAVVALRDGSVYRFRLAS